MGKFLKGNLSIVLAFTLPVAFMIAVALIIYLPAHSVSTEYNFVYATCMDGNDYYYCNRQLQGLYSVADGKLQTNTIDLTIDLNRNKIPDVDENYRIRYFLHDTKNNESREISLTQIEEMNLDGLLTAPDGVTVSKIHEYGSDFLFFYGGSVDGYFLTKGNKRTKMNFIDNGYRDITFIGWVLPNEN